MRIIEVSREGLDEIVPLAANVFMTDNYFMKMYPDEKVRYQELLKGYREGAEICLSDDCGKFIVLEDNGRYLAFLLYVDYVKLRRCNLEGLKKIFGMKFSRNKITSQFVAHIHRSILKLKENPVYVLAIGVDEEYRHKRLGTMIFDYFLDKFKGKIVVSDVSGKYFLKLCLSHGFEAEQISDVCHFVIKK